MRARGAEWVWVRVSGANNRIIENSNIRILNNRIIEKIFEYSNSTFEYYTSEYVGFVFA